MDDDDIIDLTARGLKAQVGREPLWFLQLTLTVR
jgi:hypothetical protein